MYCSLSVALKVILSLLLLRNQLALDLLCNKSGSTSFLLKIGLTSTLLNPLEVVEPVKGLAHHLSPAIRLGSEAARIKKQNIIGLIAQYGFPRDYVASHNVRIFRVFMLEV